MYSTIRFFDARGIGSYFQLMGGFSLLGSSAAQANLGGWPLISVGVR